MALLKIIGALKKALENPEQYPEISSEEIDRINELTRKYFSKVIKFNGINERDVMPFERWHAAEMCILEKRKLEVLVKEKEELFDEEDIEKNDNEIRKITGNVSNKIFDQLLPLIIKIDSILHEEKSDDIEADFWNEEEFVMVQKEDKPDGYSTYQEVEIDREDEEGYDYIPLIRVGEKIVNLI